MIPFSFRLLISQYIEINKDNIATIPYSSLLGFGDAAIPGIFLIFVAFYDACWRIPYYRHFLGGLLGYSLGYLVTIIVLHVSGGSQPGLLYLCPFTFLVTFIVVVICDGLNEWKLLWSGSLPISVNNANINLDGDDNQANRSADLLEVNGLFSTENNFINSSKVVLVPVK
ncbi:unnamed protein product [Schistosoma turkestanicum]|nr:unnamed protein product [Schistosoma turkestanicum]